MSFHLEQILNGVFKLTFGTPETMVPSAQSYVKVPLAEEIAKLPETELPFRAGDIVFSDAPRGCRLEIPFAAGEELFGFGLQLKSLRQAGKKRALRVNSDPIADTGDSHAPAPLYFSTAGYGVMLDTARYAVFNTGGNVKLADRSGETAGRDDVKLSEAELYAAAAASAPVIAEVPGAHGITLYLFTGPRMLDALRRYILFCGGGCLVPEWSLGNTYRACGSGDQKEVERLAAELRDKEIPCDVLGLEPGWQSRAYSCSFVWSEERFPAHEELLKKLNASHYRVNLWEHAFVHPESLMYAPLKKYAGEFEVWKGLVPDFSIPEAARIFREYHEKELVEKGVSSFKLDECDNSDFVYGPWSFPECSRFPSGCDGEQMHSLFGMHYQEVIENACRAGGVRSAGSVRNSHLFAPPQPFVLYSDLYDHKDFLRGVTTCGFSGMLWTPELRHARTVPDYIRRLQSMVLAPQMLMNIWSMPHPPWRQLQKELNCKGEFYPEEEQQKLEAVTREILEMRMGFIPYLYAAFADYRFHGIPPFRALALECPEDVRLHAVDTAWMAGENLLVAPFTAGMEEYLLALPPGVWRDYYTGETHEGEVLLRPELTLLPILVRDNSVIPVARPVCYVENGMTWRIDLRVYGENPRPARLYADDGWSFGYERDPDHWGEVTPQGELSSVLAERYAVEGTVRFR